jgi:hypothetical protein
MRHEPERPAAAARALDAPEPPRRTFLAELDAADIEAFPLGGIAVAGEIIILHRQRIDAGHLRQGIARAGEAQSGSAREERGTDQRG